MFKKFSFLLLILFSLSACQSSEPTPVQNIEPQPCTQEAKICPDGSSVGHTGPSCEFAACPTSEPSNSEQTEDNLPSATDANANWQTMTDQKTGLTFAYPKTLKAKYTQILVDDDFLPTIKLEKGELFCEDKKSSESIEAYCQQSVESEGAAGSNYRHYSYAGAVEDQLAHLDFTLRQVNCLNYDDPEQSECKKEQADFKVDVLAESILKTISFKKS